MLGGLGYQTDAVPDQVHLLVVHLQTQLAELVDVRDHLHEGVVLHDAHDRLGLEAVTDVEVPSQVYFS